MARPIATAAAQDTTDGGVPAPGETIRAAPVRSAVIVAALAGRRAIAAGTEDSTPYLAI